ncbi:MAG TPA: hypothetical protein PLI45_00140 [Candidatus Woesebacteria bacterium]|nr:hypothetical protein [Candidatus Woesebacteria bacterium]
MSTKVGAWDCPYCGTKGNPGFEYGCSGCEHPRPKGVRFYLPDNAPEATSEQVEKMGHDPNWYCSYCESGNVDRVKRCWKCGAPRGSDSAQHSTRVFVGNDIPRSAEEAEKMEETVTPETEKPYVPTEDLLYGIVNEQTVEAEDLSQLSIESEDIKETDSDRRKKRWTITGVILSVLLVFVGIYFFFIRTTEQIAVVDGFSWTQNVLIEEYQTHQKEGWSIPVGGRETGSEIRQSGTVKVTDGYHTETQMDTCYRSVTVPQTCTRDNGNGSFDSYDCSYSSSESYSCTNTVTVEDYHFEPVYDTWYFYDIDEWTAIGNYPTSGNDHSPYYDDAQPVGNLQRRIEQPGVYKVFFSSEGLKPFSRTYSLETWKLFEYDQEHIIKINAFKIILEVE